MAASSEDSRSRAKDPRRDPSTPGGRVAATILAALVVAAARFLPLPGVHLARADLPFKGRASPIVLGIAPYLTAALIVELLAAIVPRLRPLRESGAAGRAKLARVSAIAALLLASIEAFGLATRLDTAASGVDVGRVTLTLVAGTAACMLLASFVGRRGLANGVLVVVAANAVAGAIDDALTLPRGVGLPPKPILLGTVAAVMLVTALFLRKRAAQRDVAIRAPVAGVWPVTLAAAALGAFAARGGPRIRALLDDATGYVAGWIVLTVVCTVALATLLVDAPSLARIWARASPPDRAAEGADAELKKAASDALAPSLTFVLLLVLIGEADATLASYALDVFGLAIAGALLADAAAEASARRRLGALASVWTDCRAAALAAAARALASAGIDFHVRDERQRLLLQTLGPFAPSELLVADADAPRAREILEPLFAEPAGASSSVSEKESGAATTGGSGAALAAAVALGVTLILRAVPPTLPAPTAGGAIEPSGRSTLEVLAIDDDADPFAGTATPLRGVRIRTEIALDGAKLRERHYVAFFPMDEAGDDIERTVAEAMPFVTSIDLPPGDRLLLGRLGDDAEGGKTHALRTFVVRGSSVVGAADILRAAALAPDDRVPSWSVGVELKPDAAARLRAFSTGLVGRRVAIVVDGAVVGVMVLREELGAALLVAPPIADTDERKREVERLARALDPR